MDICIQQLYIFDYLFKLHLVWGDNNGQNSFQDFESKGSTEEVSPLPQPEPTSCKQYLLLLK